MLTLALDDAAQARFDAERLAWFPPGRTQVGAHVTLFHALPGPLLPDVRDDLHAVTRAASFRVEVTGLGSLGRGVAYQLSSPELASIHSLLRERWSERLTRQDAQPFRPHVTIQNKVSPETARESLATLSADFVPFSVDAVGLDLWRYDGGPWTALDRFPFE